MYFKFSLNKNFSNEFKPQIIIKQISNDNLEGAVIEFKEELDFLEIVHLEVNKKNNEALVIYTNSYDDMPIQYKIEWNI